MKLIKYFLVLFLILLPLSVHAQEKIRMQISDVMIEDGPYQTGDIIEGRFLILNLEERDIGNIYYEILLQDKLEGFSGDSSRELKTEKYGPITVKAEEKKNIPFQIEIPKGVGGELFLSVKVNLNQTQRLGGTNSKTFEVTGGEKLMAIALNQMVLSNGDIHPLGAGPTIYQDKEPKSAQLYVVLGSYSKETQTVYSEISIRKLGSDEVLQKIEGEPMIVSVKREGLLAESDKTFIPLPTFDYSPGVYVGELVFKNAQSGKTISETKEFRYIIGGTTASIISITSDKERVDQGESFNLKIDYWGQPVDISGNVDIQKAVTQTKISVLNQKGQEVAVKDLTLDYNDGGSLRLDFTAEEEAERMKVVILSTLDGKEFLRYEQALSEDFEEQLVMEREDKTPLLVLLWSVIGIIVVVALIILIKTLFKNSGPTTLVLILILLPAGIAFADFCADYFYVTVTGIPTITYDTQTNNFIIDPGEEFYVDVTINTRQCDNKPIFATTNVTHNRGSLDPEIETLEQIARQSCNEWEFCAQETYTFTDISSSDRYGPFTAPTTPGPYSVDIDVEVLNGVCDGTDSDNFDYIVLHNSDRVEFGTPVLTCTPDIDIVGNVKDYVTFTPNLSNVTDENVNYFSWYHKHDKNTYTGPNFYTTLQNKNDKVYVDAFYTEYWWTGDQAGSSTRQYSVDVDPSTHGVQCPITIITSTPVIISCIPDDYFPDVGASTSWGYEQIPPEEGLPPEPIVEETWEYDGFPEGEGEGYIYTNEDRGERFCATITAEDTKGIEGSDRCCISVREWTPITLDFGVISELADSNDECTFYWKVSWGVEGVDGGVISCTFDDETVGNLNETARKAGPGEYTFYCENAVGAWGRDTARCVQNPSVIED
jgi:hypothetical protein